MLVIMVRVINLCLAFHQSTSSTKRDVSSSRGNTAQSSQQIFTRPSTRSSWSMTSTLPSQSSSTRRVYENRVRLFIHLRAPQQFDLSSYLRIECQCAHDILFPLSLGESALRVFRECGGGVNPRQLRHRL